MNAPLRMGVVITADASSLKAEASSTRQELAGLRSVVSGGDTAMQAYARATEQAAAAHREAAAAAAGRSAAERDLSSAVAQFAGIRTPSNDNYAARAADIEAYGREMDQLRARFDPVFAASKQYEAELNELNRAHALGAINTAQHSVALTMLNGRYQQAAAGADVFAASSTLAQMQTRNLAFQFQDIATMLAMGQSPFMLLAQQLPQITMYGGQLTGTMGALKQTFAGIFSPLGLLTTGFVLAGSAAVAYFADTADEADKAAEILDEQVALARRVADQWGDAVPAVKAYADELERVRDLEDLKLQGKKMAEDLYAPLQQAAADLRVEVVDFVSQLQDAGAEASTVDGLQDAFNELQQKVADNTASAEDAQGAQEALNEAMRLGVGDAESLASAFSTFIDALRDVADEADTTRGKIDDLLDRGGIPRSKFEGGRGSDPRKINFEDEGGYWRDRYLPDPEQPERTRRVRRPRRSEAERDAEQLKKFIRAQEEEVAMLQLEIALVGQSAETRSQMIATLEAEQEIRARGIDGMSAESKAIRANAAEIAALELELERIGEAWGEFEDLGASSIDRLVESAGKGFKDIGEVLDGIKDDWIKFILQMGVANPLKNWLLPGQNNGTIADIGSQIASLFGLGGGSDPAAALTKAIGAQSTALMQVQAGTVMVNGGIAGAAGGAGGFGGILSSLFGGTGGGDWDYGWLSSTGNYLFDKGGHTGGSDPSRIAGFVHEEEFVVNARATRQPGVRPLLEAINSGRLGGYREGGFAARSGAGGGGGMAPFGVQAAPTTINIIDNAGVRKETKRSKGADGSEMIEIILERVGDRIADGGYDDHMTRFGAQPVKVGR